MQLGKENSQHNFLPLSTAVVSVRKLPGGLWVWMLGLQLVWGPTVWGASETLRKWNAGRGGAS